MNELEPMKYKGSLLTFFIGLGSIAVGIDIATYGKLRALIQLENKRYLVGGVFIVFGLYACIACLVSLKK